MTKEDKKSKIKLFGCIFGIVILFTLILYPHNYCSDYYNLVMDGYTEYANYWYASAGRTVGMLVLYLMDFLNVDMKVYIFIMKIFALIIATCSIYIFTNMCFNRLKQLKEKTSKSLKITVIVAALITFLNMGSYQFFYYAESAVMWLGVLLTVIAVRFTINKDDKLRYLEAFIALYFAMNCYQATILLYIPMTLLFVGLDKTKIKELLFEVIKLSLVVAVCLGLGYIIIQLLNDYFDITPFRNNAIAIRLEAFLTTLSNLILLDFEEYPNYFYASIYSIIIILSMLLKKVEYKNRKAISVLTITFIILSAFLQVFLIVSLIDFYIADRIVFSYYAVFGLSILYFIMYTKVFENRIFLDLITALLIGFMIYMIINANYFSALHRIARVQDNNEGYDIANEIKEYEKESGCKITKIVYCEDLNVNYDWPNLRVCGDPTFRLFASEWVIENLIEYYSGNKIESCIEDSDVLFDIFDFEDWNEFSVDQMVFEKDTMYFCIY